MNTKYNWLRWIAVLPSSVAAYIIVSLIFWGTAILASFLIDSDTIDLIIREVMSCIVASYAFVAAGSEVAPNYKKQTALTLLIIGVVYSVVGLYAAVTLKHWANIATGISIMIGLGFGYAEVHKKETYYL